MTTKINFLTKRNRSIRTTENLCAKCNSKGGVLFENRPALYFCNYKENKKNNIATYIGYLIY